MNWASTLQPDLNAPGPFLTESQNVQSLHQAKTSPESGDWLDAHEEHGQTFSHYFHSFPNGPSNNQKVLYVLPLGNFSEQQRELIDETADLLSRYYNLPTRVQEPFDLSGVPDWAQRNETGELQLLTTYLLYDVLKPRRPADAVAVLGLTEVDLWPGAGWNFVFGQASPENKVGVWSLNRYGDPNASGESLQMYRERTFKVAVHETGHMLGIAHCIYYECLMNGSNHLAEMDSRPLWLCPECVRKVWWNCSAIPTERYASLLKFAEKHKLQKAADFWRRSILRFQ